MSLERVSKRTYRIRRRIELMSVTREAAGAPGVYRRFNAARLGRLYPVRPEKPSLG